MEAPGGLENASQADGAPELEEEAGGQAGGGGSDTSDSSDNSSDSDQEAEDAPPAPGGAPGPNITFDVVCAAVTEQKRAPHAVPFFDDVPVGTVGFGDLPLRTPGNGTTAVSHIFDILTNVACPPPIDQNSKDLMRRRELANLPEPLSPAQHGDFLLKCDAWSGECAATLCIYETILKVLKQNPKNYEPSSCFFLEITEPALRRILDMLRNILRRVYTVLWRTLACGICR